MGKGFPTYYHIDSLKTQSTTKMHVKRQKVYFIVLNLGLELSLFPSGYSIFLFFSRGENSRKYTGASTNREGFADILNASLTGKILLNFVFIQSVNLLWENKESTMGIGSKALLVKGWP